MKKSSGAHRPSDRPRRRALISRSARHQRPPRTPAPQAQRQGCSASLRISFGDFALDPGTGAEWLAVTERNKSLPDLSRERPQEGHDGGFKDLGLFEVDEVTHAA